MTQQELELKLNSFAINSVANEQLIHEYGLATTGANILAQLVDKIRDHTLNGCYCFLTEEAIEALDKLSEVVNTTRVAYAQHSFKLRDALCDRLTKAINTQTEQ